MVPSCGNSCHWGLCDSEERETVSHSVVSAFATLWTVVRQAPLSVEFSRQEYWWSGLPFPPPGDPPDSWIEHTSPTLWADSLLPEPQGGLVPQQNFKDEELGILVS